MEMVGDREETLIGIERTMTCDNQQTTWRSYFTADRCRMCSALTPWYLVRVLNLFDNLTDPEVRVTVMFSVVRSSIRGLFIRPNSY